MFIALMLWVGCGPFAVVSHKRVNGKIRIVLDINSEKRGLCFELLRIFIGGPIIWIVLIFPSFFFDDHDNG